MSIKEAYQKALGYLSKSPKTIRQMEEYLANKGYDITDVEKVVKQLLSFNYLDDRAFAKSFIENRTRYKPKSVFALEYELRQKGIDPVLAKELLAACDDVKLALKAIAPKEQAWSQLNPLECRKKMMNYLRYRGFDYDVCNKVWQEFQGRS